MTDADAHKANVLAAQLDALNRERRSIEADMHDDALAHLETFAPGNTFGLALYDPGWHQGVIGILAARIRSRFHRPVIAFARGQPGELRGSGRSVPNLHLRDALDLIDKRVPGLLKRFGGHAAAAGLTIRETDFEAFRSTFDATLRTLLTPDDLRLRIETDGALSPHELSLSLADELSAPVWGQGFPPPRFRGDFRVDAQRVVGGRHLRFALTSFEARARPVNGVLFGASEPLPDAIRAVFRLDVDEYNGARSLQLVLDHWQGC